MLRHGYPEGFNKTNATDAAAASSSAAFLFSEYPSTACGNLGIPILEGWKDSVLGLLENTKAAERTAAFKQRLSSIEEILQSDRTSLSRLQENVALVR